MIRVVSIPKAVIAGLLGAVVMEITLAAASLTRFASIDLVREISISAIPNSTVAANALAIAVHLSIGICWAVFYAFFVWGRIHARPAIQGLSFAIVPASLAILVVYPELALMRLHVDVVRLGTTSFFAPLSAATIGTLVVAHALFGVTVGAIYRKPVGYAS